MIRSRVALGMCLDDGALFKTAETVPGESPTDAATDFSVTAPPFFSAAFLSCVISPMERRLGRSGSVILQRATPCTMRSKGSHYMATLSGRKFFAAIPAQKKTRTRVLDLLELRNG